MTLAELLYAVILAIVGGNIAFLVSSHRREALSINLLFQVSFWFRAAIVILNNDLNFFVQKYNSDFSIGLMDQRGGIWALFTGSQVFSTANVTAMKFFVEALMNIPAVRGFEDSPVMLNYTNAFVGAMAGVVAYAYARRLFGERVGTYAFLVASLYPAAINFSFFGLRDIIIYTFLVVNVFSFSWLMLRKDYRFLNWFVYGVSLVGAIFLRVTFTPFLLVLPSWFIFRAVWEGIGRVPALHQRMFLVIVAAAMIFVAGSLALLAGYVLVLHQVGITTLVMPDVLLQDYASARASRGVGISSEFSAAAGVGTNSEYLPLSIYLHLPWPVRAAVQIAGFIELPFPWQLTSASRALGLVDSIFVWLCMVWAWKMRGKLSAAARGKLMLPPYLRAYSPKTLARLSVALILCFISGWLGFGLLVSDAGNAFRMRLSVVPFLLFGASLYAPTALGWLALRLENAVAAARPARTAPELAD